MLSPSPFAIMEALIITEVFACVEPFDGVGAVKFSDIINGEVIVTCLVSVEFLFPQYQQHIL